MRQLILNTIESVGKVLPSWLPVDKALHFALCYVSTLAGTFVDIYYGAGVGTGLGVGKELGDMMNPHNKWDWKDLVWDFGGVALGVITKLVINL